MKKVAPQFFGMTVAGVGAASSLLGASGGLFKGAPKQTHLDDAAVRQQMQAKQIAAQQQEGAAQRVQQQSTTDLQAQQVAARQRVEALDRVVGAFQQNMRI